MIDDRDPGARAEQADDISIGFLHLLERLKPRERVAFVLTDVFREPHQAVSDALGTSVANARQLLHRARAKVSAAPRPNRASANEISDVLDAFGRACAGGDVDALLHLLAPDVVLVSDGGRDHHAARRPVVGPARVARLMMNLARRFPADGTIEVANVNTQPALVVRRRGRPVWLQTFELRDGRIWRMRLIVNPAKLGRLDQPVTLR